MNDWTIRVGIAAIAGLTYFTGAIPDSIHFNQLLDVVTAKTWLMMGINILTGIFSPSLLKAVAAKTGLTK